MTSQRIYGAKLILELDGTDYAADLKSCELSFEEADTDDLTFGEAAEAEDQGVLKLAAIQSTDANSFWRNVWAHSGDRDVPFKLAVHGNEVATPDKPHIKGTLDIGPRPTIGGQAGPSSYSFEVEWKAKVDKTLVIA